MRAKTPAVALLAVGLTFGLAAPASAATRSGTKSCPSGQVALRSYGDGFTGHQAPSGRIIAQWSNGSLAMVRSSASGRSSTSWVMTTTGSFIDSGTYAFCTGI